MQKIPEKKKRAKTPPPRYPAHTRQKISEGLKTLESFFVQLTPTLRVEVLPLDHEEDWVEQWKSEPIEIPGGGVRPGPLLLHFSRIGFTFAFVADRINSLGQATPLGPHQYCTLSHHIAYEQARGRVIAMHTTTVPPARTPHDLR